MPTDPYVPTTLDEEPRQAPNLAPGVHMPPSVGWRADRPGDLSSAQPEGALLGTPGPSTGYALTLANRRRDDLCLAPHEDAEDAIAVIAAIAMKRAGALSRAPINEDVEVAMGVLGYSDDALSARWELRAGTVRGAAHEYSVCRAVVDAVPLSALVQPVGGD